MLKIMIRENSTQRGNENFGAVLDSVGAVLVQCVKDVYVEHVKAQPELKGNLEAGRGIGWRIITDKEPALTRTMVDSALSTFRSTGLYLQLLKKGGLPEQFWSLYTTSMVKSSCI